MRVLRLTAYEKKRLSSQGIDPHLCGAIRRDGERVIVWRDPIEPVMMPVTEEKKK